MLTVQLRALAQWMKYTTVKTIETNMHLLSLAKEKGFVGLKRKAMH